MRSPINLHLSTLDREHLRSAVRTLLSPLEFSGTRRWCGQVERSLRRLLEADHSIFALPEGEELLLTSETAGEETLQELMSHFGGFADGRMRATDPDVDRALALRKAAGLEVHSSGLLAGLGGDRLERSPLVREILRPAGIRHHVGLRVGLDRGEADVSVAYTDGSGCRRSEGEKTGILELLLPAFRAGVKQLLAARSWPHEIGASLDALQHPVLIVDLDGREIHRATELSRILADDPEREWVLAAIRSLGRDTGRLYRRHGKTDRDVSDPLGERELQTPAGRYRIRGTTMRVPGVGTERVVLVAVERRGARLPTARTLVDRCDLTPREAEIALLLARGLPDQAVARRLFISPHTVRTHARHIFAKLDIHSRNALLLQLCLVEAEPDPWTGPWSD